MLRAFRTALLPLLLALLVGPAAAQESKTVTDELPLARDGAVLVDNYKGSIVVRTWDRDVVQVEARVVADEQDELVEDTQIHISRSGDVVRIETDYEEAKRNRRNGWSLFRNNNYSLPFVHYTIYMPATADLAIDDYKSEIEVTDLHADLQVETYKGLVDVKGLDGALRLDTYKGTVRVAFSDLAADSYVDTYKGDISLWLPRSAGFTLDADTGRKGSLDSDFALQVRTYRDEALRAEVQGGGPVLRLETYKGSFALRHQ